MIKKLRAKIILMTMSVIGIMLLIVAITYSLYSINGTKNRIFQSLEREISKYEERSAVTPPDAPTEIGKGEGEGTIYKFDVCVAKSDKSTGEITTLSTDVYIDEKVLTASINEILKDRKRSGELPKYKLLYSYADSPDAVYFALTDNGILAGEVTSVWLNSLLIFGTVFAAIFILSIFLSKMAVKPVEKSIEEQKRFIADASHELKTPLAVISANTKILKNIDTGVNPKTSEWLKSTEEEVDHMSSIIADMLNLAQSEALREISKSEFDMTRLASQICLQFEALSYDKNVSLEYEIEDGINYFGNEKMIKQLFMIFIDNAIKYEPSGGKILVNLKKYKNKKIFSVKNFGTVISKEDLPHVFERFYRADKARTSGGVGLGLSIAKNIIDLHGGTVKVLSEQNIGTEFKVLF